MVRDPGVVVSGSSMSAMSETNGSNVYLQMTHKQLRLLLRMTKLAIEPWQQNESNRL
jgi:hypothetical protein